MAKHKPEFFSDWHQERYISDLQRELEGAKVRGDDDYAKAVEAELARFKPKRTAKK